MKLSITDIEDGRAQIVDFGTAFVIFFGNGAVFGCDKALFTLSCLDSVCSEAIDNGIRLYWENNPSLTRSYLDLTASEYGSGIALNIEAMHDCFLDIKTDKDAIESMIGEGGAVRLRIGAVTAKTVGSCYFENEGLKLRRGTSRILINGVTSPRLFKDNTVCFKHESHKVNELIFNGKEISESDPLFPFLLLSEGLLRGQYDTRRKDSLYRMARLLPKAEKERALTVINRYLRAFGMPALKEKRNGTNHLTQTEFNNARSFT